MPPPVPIGNTPLERAYRWYSRLNGPPHAEMMATVNKMPSMDITADYVDLLPWIGATKTMLNLGVINAVRDERKQKEAQRRADMEQRRRRR